MTGLFVIGQKEDPSTHQMVDWDISHLVAKGGLKVDYEMLTADTSGRTADGNMHIDLVANWLKHKVTVTFIPCSPATVSEILSQIYSYISGSTPSVPIKFYDPKTGAETSNWVNTYPGTPSITWNTLASGKQQTSAFSISFIQM